MRALKIVVSIIGIAALVSGTSSADPATRWPQPRFAEPPVTWDGMNVLEGTAAAPRWSWHARLATGYQYGVGLADRTSQFRGGLGFGVGLPLNLEAALAMPVGWTVGSKERGDLDGSSRSLEGMGEDGPGVGDLTAVLLWSALDATKKGLGLLIGFKAGVPTGKHERLMGEGGMCLEPMVSLALHLLGSRLALNLAYRIRPEHVSHVKERRFEQDDDLVWRVGVRVPRKHDVAWSVEAEGMIGTATDEGVWPSSRSRPVWIGAGLDFPLGRLYRLGLLTGFGVSGETAPAITFGIHFLWMPVMPDEDKDGIGGVQDQCPLLVEDVDGFEDDDGCPDLDNDKDGFPDDEDRCPMQPAADDFSEDGC